MQIIKSYKKLRCPPPERQRKHGGKHAAQPPRPDGDAKTKEGEDNVQRTHTAGKLPDGF